MKSHEVPVWRRLASGWTAIAGRFGFVQTVVLLVLFYTLLIGPAAIATAALRRDLLGKRGLREGGSAWANADTAGADLERVKRLS